MEQYISKSALVAEIDRRIEINNTCQKISGGNEFYRGAIDESKEILSFLDTLEVKDVDLEEKLSLIDDSFFDLGDGVAVKGATHYLTIEDIKEIAKLYFEYGLAAQKGEEV